jgi:hypothetical protein
MGQNRIPKGMIYHDLLSSELRRINQPVEKPLYASSGSPSRAQNPPLQCFGLVV